MKAYAPGSVTGVFAPAPVNGDEPSRGASVAIADGVSVDVTPAAEITVTVEGESAPFEPIAQVLSNLDVTAAVNVLPQIPLGHGFGASGAATLATALAATAVFDLDKSREEILYAAHCAELAAGTGQGDVFIQNRGGLVWSISGETHRNATNEPVEYATAGGIDTSEMLADETFMADARQSGTKHLDRLEDPPTVRALAERSRTYLEEIGIATPFVEQTLDRVEAAGGTGSMALFGETVFAVDVDGVLPNRTTIATEGASLVVETG